jgi:hypothetical protein
MLVPHEALVEITNGTSRITRSIFCPGTRFFTTQHTLTGPRFNLDPLDEKPRTDRIFNCSIFDKTRCSLLQRVQIAFGSHLDSYRLLHHKQSGGTYKSTIYLRLVARLRMRGTIPPYDFLWSTAVYYFILIFLMKMSTNGIPL